MKPQPKALIRNAKLKRIKGPPILDDGAMEDAREESFVRMVADGLPIGAAFERAGFKSTFNDAPYKLFRLPRIQARIEAVLEARRTTNVVTLPEVTDMLKRVYAGATSREEYNAAHNAAFSLARLYGHVTDRATVEVLRRPSRDPDAPAEQALGSWVESLPGPVIEARAIEALPVDGPAIDGPQGLREAASPDARQPVNGGPGPEATQVIDWTREIATGPESRDGQGPAIPQGPGPAQADLFNDFKGLAGPEPTGQPGNGAPTRPVTGAPNKRARTVPKRKGLKRPPRHPKARASKKRVPSKAKRVPPPMGDLF